MALRPAGVLLFLSAATVTVLSIVSFVFALVALTSTDWATQAQYDLDPTDPSIDTRNLSAIVSRGPREQCTWQRNETDPDAPWFTTCDRGGCLASDLGWWCQQQAVGAHLLVAGTVFAGLACLYAMVTLALMLPWAPEEEEEEEESAAADDGTPPSRRLRRHRGGWRHRLTRWRHPDHEQRLAFVLARGGLNLLLVLGIVTYAAGTLVLANLLVNQQPQDASFISSAPAVINEDHWLIGKGVVYATLAWLPSLVALLCMPSVEMVFVARRGGMSSTTRKNGGSEGQADGRPPSQDLDGSMGPRQH